jgi:hypothetical protein
MITAGIMMSATITPPTAPEIAPTFDLRPPEESVLEEDVGVEAGGTLEVMLEVMLEGTLEGMLEGTLEGMLEGMLEGTLEGPMDEPGPV